MRMMAGSGYEERYFSNIRGEKFFYRMWRLRGARAALILIHALGLHSGRYTWLCEGLSFYGVNCYAVDLYGHGLSNGGRGRGTFADLLNAASKFLELVMSRERNSRIVLMGHGAGALAALVLASRYDRVSGLLAFSPLAELIEISNYPLTLKLFSLLGLKVRIPLIPPWDVNHPDARLEVKADKLVNRKLSAKLISSTLDLLRRIGRVETPFTAVLHEEGEIFSQGFNEFSRLVSDVDDSEIYDPSKESFPFERVAEWLVEM